MTLTLAHEIPGVIVREMLTPSRAIDYFLDDGKRRGWSERTLSTYRHRLDEFDQRLPLDYDVSDITETDIRRYLGSKSHRARGTVAHAEAVLSSFFRWCYFNRKIKTNPMDRIERTRRIPAAELDVVTVSPDDVRKLLAAAKALDIAASSTSVVWTHRACLCILVYLGPRRRAVARLRLRDWDRDGRKIRFREKGGKTIWKPVPDELHAILVAALEDGAYAKPASFLVPPAPHAVYAADVLDGHAERDDRCIWEIVRDVGKKAGVETHVHALRAAFACFFLEQNPGNVEALQKLLGHRSIQTTQTYLRRSDSDKQMEHVRSLSWVTM